MKFFKTFLFLILLWAPAKQEALPLFKAFADFPPKTVFIKHPAADDTKTFFSGSQVYHFEIYKVDSKAEKDAIINSFLKNKEVGSFTAGAITGDYSAFTLTIKANKNKAWFVALFKKAGLNTIKINNGEVIGIDKL